ncbi:hypothetical protein SETIT_2G106000v2 [Setaria italica]|uniref:Uncharacterized protein n=1 Tax=Setaria italica TaxID=4555 RepID=A0A368PZE6_SETIT|nr:hypothetical protein SETIT_2G106000v2 [Setaria italica]
MTKSLLLPTQDDRLFATTFLLLFAHTFVSIAVAVHYAHPLATSILSDVKALKAAAATSHNYDRAVVGTTWEHGKKLFLIYLAYVASKLATQLAVTLAASATYSGEHLTRKVVKERIGGLLGTAAFAGVLELSLTALLVARTSLALLPYVYLGTGIPVSVAASAVDRGCHSLMKARTKEEAAVLVFVVNLLPAVVYPAPVYAFSFVYPADEYSLYYPVDRFSISNEDVWLIGVVSGSGLPTVGAQLFSMVTATVFCGLSMGSNAGGAAFISNPLM